MDTSMQIFILKLQSTLGIILNWGMENNMPQHLKNKAMNALNDIREGEEGFLPEDEVLNDDK